MMYITKEVIEKVGYLHKDYGFYGYEHAGYSQRIFKAGLIPHPYLVPTYAGEYIYSLDFDNHLNFNIEHKSSVNILEVNKLIEQNKNVYLQDIKTIKIKQTTIFKNFIWCIF